MPAITLEDGSVLIRIKVIPNFELEQVLLSFGESVIVLEPEVLKNRIKERVTAASKNYEQLCRMIAPFQVIFTSLNVAAFFDKL